MTRAMIRMRGSMGAAAGPPLSLTGLRHGLGASVSGQGGRTLVWNYDCLLVVPCAALQPQRALQATLLLAGYWDHRTRNAASEK